MEFKESFSLAMAKFQETYNPPLRSHKVDFKTAKGQRIKYDYADLTALQLAIRTAGAPLGLAFITRFEQFEQFNALWLRAVVTITHPERDFEVEGIPLFVMNGSGRIPDAQASGSLRTYAERYALQSAFGIASDSDDDGAIAKDRHQIQPSDEQAQQHEDNQPSFSDWVNEKYEELGKLTGYGNDEITVMLEGAVGGPLRNAERAMVVAKIKETITRIKKEQAKQQQQPQNNFKWGA